MEPVGSRSISGICIAVLLYLVLTLPVHAAEAREKGVQLGCAGDSCIQIGIRQPQNGGVWTLYFYTRSPTDITVERAMQQALTPSGTPIAYTATYFHNPAGYAAMIINGTPKTTDGAFGSKFWSLCVNGKPAKDGMSIETVKNGAKVLWVYGSDSRADCSD